MPERVLVTGQGRSTWDRNRVRVRSHLRVSHFDPDHALWQCVAQGCCCKGRRLPGNRSPRSLLGRLGLAGKSSPVLSPWEVTSKIDVAAIAQRAVDGSVKDFGQVVGVFSMVGTVEKWAGALHGGIASSAGARCEERGCRRHRVGRRLHGTKPSGKTTIPRDGRQLHAATLPAMVQCASPAVTFNQIRASLPGTQPCDGGRREDIQRQNDSGCARR
jgi:hypothetical protein